MSDLPPELPDFDESPAPDYVPDEPPPEPPSAPDVADDYAPEPPSPPPDVSEPPDVSNDYVPDSPPPEPPSPPDASTGDPTQAPPLPVDDGPPSHPGVPPEPPGGWEPPPEPGTSSSDLPPEPPTGAQPPLPPEITGAGEAAPAPPLPSDGPIDLPEPPQGLDPGPGGFGATGDNQSVLAPGQDTLPPPGPDADADPGAVTDIVDEPPMPPVGGDTTTLPPTTNSPGGEPPIAPPLDPAAGTGAGNQSVTGPGQPATTGGDDPNPIPPAMPPAAAGGDISLGTATELVTGFNGPLSPEAALRLQALAEPTGVGGVSGISPDELAKFIEDEFFPEESTAGDVTVVEITETNIGTLIEAGGDVIVFEDGDAGVVPVLVESIEVDEVTLRHSDGGRSRMPRADFDKAWDECGNKAVPLPPPVPPVPPTVPPAAPPMAPISLDETDDGIPTPALIAGAVALPLLIGGGYLATKRLRR